MMEGSDIIAAEAIIDNGRFGKRVVRFETGRLAKQAAGSALAYLDDSTTVLSATTVGKNPKDQFDFFPLTVDVEERQYAAGRIPGSFFRREGRAGTEAILAARLIDRPLRPGFVKGLRNEVQVVETVLTIDPDDAYDVLAINAASMSTQIAGLPFTGPIGGTRLALIDGQWVAFPRWSELERSVFNIVVAGRIVTKEDGSEDVAIMMVEAGGGKNEWELIQAGATAPTEDVVADGLEAAKPFIKALCEAQIKVAEKASKETADFPLFLDYTDEEYAAVEEYAAEKVAQALLTEASSPATRPWMPSRKRCSVPWPSASPSRRRPSRPRSVRSRRPRSVIAPCVKRSAWMAVPRARSVLSPPRLRSCPACTAPPCSSAVRPRSWA